MWRSSDGLNDSRRFERTKGWAVWEDECLTLEDEGTTILRNVGKTRPATQAHILLDLILSSTSVWTVNLARIFLSHEHHHVKGFWNKTVGGDCVSVMWGVTGLKLALRQIVLVVVVCGLFSLRKESLGRPRRRWEDNIKHDLTEMIEEGVDFTDLRSGTCGRLLWTW